MECDGMYSGLRGEDDVRREVLHYVVAGKRNRG